jgi:hypothetical protein
MRTTFIVLGVAMLLVALAWRARDLRRRSGGIEAALRSPDPFTRTRALREMASVGLRPWAAMLLTRTEEVPDGIEADELVWLIGACQWEPADEPAIVQLRLWAARRLERAPVVPDPVAPVMVAPVAVETLDLADADDGDAPELIEIAVPVVRANTEAEPEVLEPEVIAVEEPEPHPEVVDVPEPELVPALAVPARDRPGIVDEIESIVGARVLAVRFVPLTGAAA